MLKERTTLKGHRILTLEERKTLKKLVSEIQRPKYFREKRLLKL